MVRSMTPLLREPAHGNEATELPAVPVETSAEMTATFPKMTTAPHHRLCPACGELLVSSRCPECAPIEPARPYSERITQPVSGASGAMSMASTVDVRRATGEWVTGPDDREPQTRRAHPTLVRTALAEAEERALDKIARSALVTHVAATTRPRFGSPTSPRLRPVTPLPPAPANSFEEISESAPVQTSSAVAIESIESRASTEAEISPDLIPMVPDIIASQPLAIAPIAVSQIASPRSPRAPEQLLPTPTPTSSPRLSIAETEPEPEPSNRRTTFFWLALLGGAAILLAIAAF